MLFTVKGKRWCIDAPLRMKYLMIAAYLASMNPKETDFNTFNDHSNIRKKRNRVSSSRSSDNTINSKQIELIGGRNRSFSFERMCCIFTSIIGFNGIDNSNSDTSMASIFGLEKKRKYESSTDIATVRKHANETVIKTYGNADFFVMVKKTKLNYSHIVFLIK
jgi:hypothetical protein